MIIDGNNPPTSRTAPRGPIRVSGQQTLFLDYLRHLERHGEGRRALQLRLSLLRPVNRRDHHVRAAAAGFDALINTGQGQLFMLGNADLLVVYVSGAQSLVEREVQRAAFLFSDDPLLKDGEGTATLAVWFDVERDFRELLSAARRGCLDAKAPAARHTSADGSGRAVDPAKTAADPLTPELLARVEAALQRADLSNLIRRRSVCGLSALLVPELRFTELSISIRDLGTIVLPGVDLTANHWLFRHLTETLDRRMLSMLAKPDYVRVSGDIAIPLNVSTLLSEAFAVFDRSAIGRRPETIVLTVRAADVFADLAGFLRARTVVRDRGYRCCLGGLDHDSATMFDLERLGTDLVEIPWQPAMAAANDDPERRSEIRIAGRGGTRTVLSGVDGPEAAIFGQSQGIALFQGPYIDRLVAEDHRRRQFSRLQRSIGDGT
ncbi:MAG: hypothetical protein ACFCUO_09910 [Rhodospirillales bacterium]